MSEYSNTKEKKVSRKMWICFGLALALIAAAVCFFLIKKRNDELDKTQQQTVVGKLLHYGIRKDGNGDLYLLCENSALVSDESGAAVVRLLVTQDTRISDSVRSQLESGGTAAVCDSISPSDLFQKELLIVAQVNYTKRAEEAARKKGETFAYTALSLDLGDPGSDYEKAPLPAFASSQQMSTELRSEWAKWDSKTQSEQMLSSAIPGIIYKYLYTWEEATDYAGAYPWNPFETSPLFEKKNAYGTDSLIVPRDKELRHAYLTFSGDRDGNVNYVGIQAGYTIEKARVIIAAQYGEQHYMDLTSLFETVPLSKSISAKMIRRQGTNYYAISLYFERCDIFYYVDVTGKTQEDAEAAYAKVLQLIKDTIEPEYGGSAAN